ncbi:MAG: hypothetical protein Q9221_001017 [Calogaya cf. arnoldii]
MPPIPGSSMSPFSLVDEDGYVYDTSVHALSDLHRRNTLLPDGPTINPSVLGKRKNDGRPDDYDDDDQVALAGEIAARQRPRGRPPKRPRPPPPSASGYDPQAPPFDWFTRRKYAPLDNNPQILWMLENGRYFGYNLATRKREPFAVPDLITLGTAEQAVGSAKAELRRQKQQITGDPKTNWSDQVYPEPQASGDAQARSRMGHPVSASATQQPLPAFNPRLTMPFGYYPTAGPSSAAPLTLPSGVVSSTAGYGNPSSMNHDGAPTAIPASHTTSTTSNYGSGLAYNTTTPNSDSRHNEDQRGGKNAESTGAQEAASGAQSSSSEQVMAANAKAGSQELKPGMSKATEPKSLVVILKIRRTHDKARSTNLPGQAMPAMDGIDGTDRSRKHGLTSDDTIDLTSDLEDGHPNPKRPRLSSILPANSAKAPKISRHEQPYTLADHMVDKKRSNKRKSTTEETVESKPKKKPRRKKETSAKSRTASGASSHRPSTSNSRKTAGSNSFDPPEDLSHVYTAEERKRAKRDPYLQLKIGRADKLAREARASGATSIHSFEHESQIHRSTPPSSKASDDMPETIKKLVEQLPPAMPAQERMASLIQQEGSNGYFAQQRAQIAPAFEPKMLDKVQPKPASFTELPPMAAFTSPSNMVKALSSTGEQERRSRLGSIPTAASGQTLASAARNTSIMQSGSIPAATSTRASAAAPHHSISNDMTAYQASQSQTAAHLPPYTSATAWYTKNGPKKSVSSKPRQNHSVTPPASASTHEVGAHQSFAHQEMAEPLWTPIPTASTASYTNTASSHHTIIPRVNDANTHTTPSYYASAGYYPHPESSYPQTSLADNHGAYPDASNISYPPPGPSYPPPFTGTDYSSTPYHSAPGSHNHTPFYHPQTYHPQLQPSQNSTAPPSPPATHQPTPADIGYSEDLERFIREENLSCLNE